MSNYKINKILVPTNFSILSDNALRQAELLTLHNSSDLVLLSILNPEIACENENKNLDYFKFISIESKMKLKAIADFVINKYNRIFLKVKIGETVECIVKAKVETESNLIVMSLEKKPNKNILPSHTLEIVKNANCPVITVPIEAPIQKFKKIIVPIRNQPYILDKLIYVVSLAKHNNAIVDLIIFYPDFKPSLRNAEISKLFKKAIEFLEQNKIKTSYTCLMGGEFVRDTLAIAKKQNADLIAISAYQSNLFNNILNKTYQEEFIEKSEIPLIIVPVKNNSIYNSKNIFKLESKILPKYINAYLS